MRSNLLAQNISVPRPVDRVPDAYNYLGFSVCGAFILLLTVPIIVSWWVERKKLPFAQEMKQKIIFNAMIFITVVVLYMLLSKIIWTIV